MENKKYLLIGEDDKFFSQVLSVKLSKEGFDVLIMPNGEEVLKVARQRKPDLILLDLIMPDKDAFETLKEIKLDPGLYDVKVIVSSGLVQKEDVEKVMALGANGFVVKTDLSFSDLITKINDLLCNSNPQTSTSS